MSKKRLTKKSPCERAVLFATDPPYLVDYDGSNHPTRNKIPWAGGRRPTR